MPKNSKEILVRLQGADGDEVLLAHDLITISLEQQLLIPFDVVLLEESDEPIKELLIDSEYKHQQNMPDTFLDEEFVEKSAPKYSYRSLPFSCTPPEKLYMILGTNSAENGISVGVQEWCVSKEDADSMLEVMKNYPEFSSLEVQKYLPDVSDLGYDLVSIQDPGMENLLAVVDNYPSEGESETQQEFTTVLSNGLRLFNSVE